MERIENEKNKAFCSNKKCTYRLCKYHIYNHIETEPLFICDLRHVTGCKLKGNNQRNYFLVVSDAKKKLKTIAKRKTKRVIDLSRQIVYDSVHEAYLATKISEDGIRKCCRGVCIHAGGHVWAYVNEEC